MQFNGPVLELLRPNALALHPTLGRLGPDVLAPGFDPHVAARNALARAEDRQVADVLLDQRVACGIGNIAKSEALWTCRTDPFLTPEQIGEEGMARLFTAGRGWLASAVALPQRRAAPHLRAPGLPALRHSHRRSGRRATTGARPGGARTASRRVQASHDTADRPNPAGGRCR